jgi:hypothetical protein
MHECRLVPQFWAQVLHVNVQQAPARFGALGPFDCATAARRRQNRGNVDRTVYLNYRAYWLELPSDWNVTQHTQMITAFQYTSILLPGVSPAWF